MPEPQRRARHHHRGHHHRLPTTARPAHHRSRPGIAARGRVQDDRERASVGPRCPSSQPGGRAL